MFRLISQSHCFERSKKLCDSAKGSHAFIGEEKWRPKNAGLIVVKVLLIPYQLNFKIVISDGL